MNDSPSPNFTAFWDSIYQQLQTELLQHLLNKLTEESFGTQLATTLQLKSKIEEHCQRTLEQHASLNNQQELASLVHLIALLEEKTREQDSTIAHLMERIEKLEEDNLQTRIEAAKHHLNSMEKLAILQQKVNAL